MEASSGYEATQELLRALVKVKRLSGEERHLVEYQIDQEFSYLKNGEVKIGDARGYMKLAGDLGVSKQTVIDTQKKLEKRRIIVVERHKVKFGNVYVNRRMINRDTSQWDYDGV